MVQTISFPLTRQEDWRALLPHQVEGLHPGPVAINCLDWLLSCKDFQKIQMLLQRAGLQIKLIQSNIPETIVATDAHTTRSMSEAVVFHSDKEVRKNLSK